MVATTILYFRAENQSPHQSNGARGPLSPAWQGLRMPVACAPLVMSFPSTVDSTLPRSVLRRWRYRAGGRVWRLTHLGVTAACQRRLAARIHTGVVADLAMGKEIIPWHDCLLMKVSSEQAPRYQPWSKHSRVWTGKDEASVGESDPQRLSLRQAYPPFYEKSRHRRTTRCSRLRTATQGSRLLTWRSRRASRWTSGIASSG